MAEDPTLKSELSIKEYAEIMAEPATPKDILDRSGSVMIGLGDGVDLELTREGDLQIIQWNGPHLKAFIPLGKGTTKRFIELRDYLDRLIIHAVDV